MSMQSYKVSSSFYFTVLSLPATILIIIPGFSDPVNLPKLLVLMLTTIMAISSFFVLRRYEERINLKSLESRIVFSLYILLMTLMLVIGISGSENVLRIFFGTSGRNNGLLYYLLVISIVLIILKVPVRDLEINYVFKLLGGTSILFLAYCVLQYFGGDFIAWNNKGNQIIGTLGNPNFSSSALAIFSCLWLYLFGELSRKELITRISCLLLSALCILLSIATGSLQGVLVASLGYALLFFTKLKEKYPSGRLPNLFGLFFGLAGIFLFVSFLGMGPLGGSLRQYTLDLRINYALFGLKGMLHSPLTGVGVDNYISAFKAFRTPDFVIQYGVELNTNNAHSVPVQVGATFGLVVFLLYFLLNLFILYKAIKILNATGNYETKIKGIAILWIISFAQSLLSIEIIGLGVLQWVLGSIVLNVSSNSTLQQVSKEKIRGSTASARMPEWVGIWKIGFFSLGIFPIIFVGNSDQHYVKFSTMQVTNNETEAWIRDEFQNLNDYVLLDSDKVLRIVGNMYKAGMLPEIEKILLNLNSLDPKDPYPLDMLSSFYATTGKINLEIEFAEKLRSLDPMNYQIDLLLARKYAQLNNIKKLTEAYEKISAIAPLSPEAKDVGELLRVAISKTE